MSAVIHHIGIDDSSENRRVAAEELSRNNARRLHRVSDRHAAVDLHGGGLDVLRFLGGRNPRDGQVSKRAGPSAFSEGGAQRLDLLGSHLPPRFALVSGEPPSLVPALRAPVEQDTIPYRPLTL